MTLGSKPAPGNLRSEITVTPLVDVCLVLLIIFMVLAPILNAGVKVDLPRTAFREPVRRASFTARGAPPSDDGPISEIAERRLL